jgi:NAD+--asparagine ADP-ribosyltransferase
MKNILKLDTVLRKILIDQADLPFTVTELKDLFISSFHHSTGKKVDLREARKWLYRHIYKMTSSGYLNKVDSENSLPSKYTLTEKFRSAIIHNKGCSSLPYRFIKRRNKM